MGKKYPLGTIIECFTGDMQILKGMIISQEEQVIEYGVNKSYQSDYAFIQLPLGVAGIIPIEYIVKDTLEESDIIYVPFSDKSNTNDIGISSIIKSEDTNYIIVGINSRYIGEKYTFENEYACMNYDNPDIFALKYILESCIDEVLDFGYRLPENIINENNRHQIVNEAISKFKNFLPIGSVVLVDSPEGTRLELVIIGRNKEIEGKFFEYVGVLYVLGYTVDTEVFRFRKNQIKEVKYCGYVNE